MSKCAICEKKISSCDDNLYRVHLDICSKCIKCPHCSKKEIMPIDILEPQDVYDTGYQSRLDYVICDNCGRMHSLNKFIDLLKELPK